MLATNIIRAIGLVLTSGSTKGWQPKRSPCETAMTDIVVVCFVCTRDGGWSGAKLKGVVCATYCYILV